MRMHQALPAILLVIAVLTVTVGLYLGFRAVGAAIRPPEWSVSPSDQTVEAEPGTAKVVVKYRVTNVGGRVLTLGEVSTTCGCSVASIEPKFLNSRESGVITVEAIPPGAGQKTVQITVSTNAKRRANLQVQLTLIGKLPVPHVANSSGHLQFGYIDDQADPGVFWVETRELRHEKPLFSEISHPMAELRVTGGLDEELPSGGDVVYRRYTYKVELQRLPKAGEFRDEILLKGSGSNSRLTHRVSVSGTVRPAVYAAPAALYVNYRSGQPAPKMTLCIAAADRKFRLAIEPPTSLPKPLSIRQGAQADGRFMVEVMFLGEPRQSISTALKFETNHPAARVVEVPLTVNLLAGDD
jgi:Protein of unknown function (DUF1573)